MASQAEIQQEALRRGLVTQQDLIRAEAQRRGLVAEQPAPEIAPTAEIAPEGPGALQQAEEAFQQIPGASVLSEIAAGFNRTVAETVNFFGVDAVNQMLEKTGTDFRLPRSPEPQGEFMDPGLGRDVARAAGETGALAVGAGGLARRAATAIAPEATSTAAQVGRQLGAGSVPQDVAVGALAGAGGEVGEDIGEAVGGETGAQVGRLAGAVIGPVAGQSIKAFTDSIGAGTLLKRAAPEIETLKTKASDLYRQVDDLGVTINEKPLQALSQKIATEAKAKGLDPDLTPKATALINRIARDTESPMTVTDIDTLRKVASVAAGSIDNRVEAAIGSRVIKQIDDFLDNIPPGSITGRAGARVGSTIKQARDLSSRAFKAEKIEDALTAAANTASGLENGIRIEFRKIVSSAKKSRGFTPDEISAMEQVIKGGKLTNVAKLLGKFGFNERQATSFLGTMVGIGAGAQIGGPIGAIAVPVVGQGFRKLAQVLTQNNAELASALVRAGKNSKSIMRAYLEHVPKDQRNSQELAGLFLSREFKPSAINALKISKDPIVANAAFIASLVATQETEANSLDTQNDGNGG